MDSSRQHEQLKNQEDSPHQTLTQSDKGLEGLKQELAENLIRQVVARVENYTGPLPHPEHAEQYERLLPGAFGRILKMAELEQQLAHRALARGQWFDFVLQVMGIFVFSAVVLGSLGLGFYFLSKGHNAVGIAGLITAAATLAGSAWYRNRATKSSARKDHGHIVE